MHLTELGPCLSLRSGIFKGHPWTGPFKGHLLYLGFGMGVVHPALLLGPSIPIDNSVCFH